MIGRSLADVTAREQVPVPRVITQCIEFLRSTGFKEVGIFRISADVAASAELQALIDENPDYDIRTILNRLHAEDAVHTAANLLKVPQRNQCERG